MPVLIVQQGHCYRTAGATGTSGEQAYATLVADACRRLLHGRGGWIVNATLADENDYHGAAFVAVHCDGSNHATARGASAGYRTPEGQAFAQAWQRAYAARGWPVFRPDNYTAALSGYYGTKRAVEAGTRRAMIIECGFLTSPVDRALLTGPGGVDRVALAIGDALGIFQSQPEDEMLTEAQNGAVAKTFQVTGASKDDEDAKAVWRASILGDQLGYVVSEIRKVGTAVAELTTKVEAIDARVATLEKDPT